ncbi:MAG TPA: helix-turn-helix transcriptional regulator [Candidatus Saccharimonadales bacterium]|nr:helix-turn-helix transcriptional regulator [Candidatus Saccharimonadales bacterium]
MDKEHDPEYVNTPAMHTGFSDMSGPPPEDRQLTRLIHKFHKGKIACRKGIVAMFWIRPYTDYRPHLTENFKEYIQAMHRFGHDYRKGPIPIVLYEHNGQLIMSADYKTYYYHRENESWTVPVLILGDFTERDFCHGIGEPFKVDSLNLINRDELMDSNTRRIALLLRNEPLRIETKEQREAVNKKDFDDAMKALVPYEPDWAKTMNKRGEDPNLVLTPALHTGHFFDTTPPEDERYTELVTRAQTGTLGCQLATIALAMMRPYSDYRPNISGELRNEFEARDDSADALRITVYEYEPGHFIVSGDDENIAIYMLYREKQLLDAWCNIVGPYTKTWAVGEIDKPFRLVLSPQAGYDPEQTIKQTGKRLRTLMREKKMYLDELSRKTGIDPDELHHLIDEYSPKAPSIEQLECIARVLEVQAADILPF